MLSVREYKSKRKITMKKVNKFIREFNLKYFRKPQYIPPEDFGTRFIADGNAHSIAFQTKIANGDDWELSIVKSHGKYVVAVTRIDSNDIVYEKTWVTSKDSAIEKLINNEVWEADDFSVKNKHAEDLNWRIDRRDIINFGELPKGFEKITAELEPVPEYITID